MSNGAVTLGDLSRYLAILDAACSKCERRGRYKVAELVKRHGAGVGLPDLRAVLAADCPRINATSIHDSCGVHYPHLPAQM
jgi:hypothetical protein